MDGAPQKNTSTGRLKTKFQKKGQYAEITSRILLAKDAPGLEPANDALMLNGRWRAPFSARFFRWRRAEMIAQTQRTASAMYEMMYDHSKTVGCCRLLRKPQ